eukprot:Anaeramoba_flamelloidesa591308_12.p1 GENE.a591308_12~~a591308_12.p1  ORF type:complete len:236 (+),score=44.03 a591308_12:31-738(+)
MTKIALVTGANRGIGFETCKQLAEIEGIHVILTSRDVEKGEQAVKKLKKDNNLELTFMQLDVTDSNSVQSCFKKVEKQFGRLDILVNNAGVYLDEGVSILDVDIEIFEKTIKVNYFGPFNTINAFLPLMIKNSYGRIVNVSSTGGQFRNTLKPTTASYNISKFSLNGLTRIFADSVSSQNIKINCMNPGWVRTDMGGQNATRSVKKAPETIIYLSTLDENGPSGEFFQDKKNLKW